MIGAAAVVNGQPFTIPGVASLAFLVTDCELIRQMCGFRVRSKPQIHGANSKQNDEWLDVAERLSSDASLRLVEAQLTTEPRRRSKAVQSSSLSPGMEKWHPVSRGWERRFASQDGNANCRERPSTYYRYRDRGFARQSCERSRRARRW